MITRTLNLVKHGMLAGALCFCAATASAQQTLNSIEVLVNDTPISSYDIDQRLRLVIAIAGGIKTQEEFVKVREQVIRAMIDERLQLDEAATVDLVISQEQLQSYFERRAQGVGQSADQFETALKGIGSSKRSMQNQMEAEIAWSQLVDGRLGPFVSVSDEEVESRITKIRNNRGKFEYRLAEITLDVTSAEQEASVKSNAEQLAARIKGGASFNEIAQQLSTSPTAAVGGDLGWSTIDDLSGFYATAANTVEVGDITEPTRTAAGYTILAMRDKRRILVADPLDTQVQLQQIFLPTVRASDEAMNAKFRDAAGNLSSTAFECKDIGTVAANAGAEPQTDLGVLRLRDLTGVVRDVVSALGENSASEIQEMEDGLRVLVVCQRQEAEIREPDFDMIFNQIEQQRLSMMGRRYLRDLRRDAIIDYR